MKLLAALFTGAREDGSCIPRYGIGCSTLVLNPSAYLTLCEWLSYQEDSVQSSAFQDPGTSRIRVNTSTPEAVIHTCIHAHNALAYIGTSRCRVAES